MRIALFLAVLAFPAAALADFYPYVQDGPVIVGVKPHEAWVTWFTAHHQGQVSGVNECYTDALTGTPNDTIPTLTLSPSSADGAVFTDPNCDTVHQVRLTGLAPDTEYTFSLDKTFQSGALAEGSFKTPPLPGTDEPFHFIVFGDDRDNPLDYASTEPQHDELIQGILAHDPDAAFVVNVGDYALNLPAVSGDDRGYTEFFDVERPLLDSRPLYATFGNHESFDTTFYDTMLSGPELAGAAHPYYYSFDWGRAHIVLLDSFEGKANPLLDGEYAPELTDQQASWLDGDLAAARRAGQLIFLVAHQGAYAYSTSAKVHGGSPDIQKKVIPLMLKYGALAIFAGHDHMYERGHEGCIDYVVCGAGGAATIEPDLNAPTVVTGTSATSYVVVSVDGNSASAVARDTSGSVIDEFDLHPASCSNPVGTPDAGTHPGPTSGDAGTPSGPGNPDGGGGLGKVQVQGCGCATGGNPLLAIAGFLLLAGLVLRRRSRAR